MRLKRIFTRPWSHLKKKSFTDKEISFRLGWEWKRLRSIPAGLQWDYNVNLLFDSCKSKWKKSIRAERAAGVRCVILLFSNLMDFYVSICVFEQSHPERIRAEREPQTDWEVAHPTPTRAFACNCYSSGFRLARFALHNSPWNSSAKNILEWNFA